MPGKLSKCLSQHGSPRVVLLFVLLSLFPAGADEPLRSESGSTWFTEGPWGRLQCYEVILNPPTNSLWDSLFDERTIWNFTGLTKFEAKELFDELGFSPALKALIYERGIWNQEGDSVSLEIDDTTIEAVSAQERLALTSWWAANDASFLSRSIINFEDRNFAAISKQLAPEIMEKIKAVTFFRGEILSTIDRAYLLRQMPTIAEKEHLIRTLFTTHALMVRLEVDPSKGVEPLINYWESGGQNPGARAVLKGIPSTQGADFIDLIHLLPPIPKKYLNSFTSLQDINPTDAPDCFWTAIQFFRPNVSNRSFDLLPVEHFVLQDYDEVTGPLQFGDLVCLFRHDTREFIHSYIHIADDLAFTKNGGSFVRPWVISTKDRMLSFYNESGEFHTLVYRRKPGV